MDSEQHSEVGLYLDVKDIDSMFESTQHPRILQNILADGQQLKDILFTTIDRGDSLIVNKPTCECGCTTLVHGTKEICDFCGTEVLPTTERSVTPSLFVAKPYLIDGFLYPYIYQACRYAFNIGTATNPYNPFTCIMGNRNSPNPIHKIILNRMPKDLRGYNNAIKDFPRFLRELANNVLEVVNPQERGVISSEVTKAHKERRGIMGEINQALILARTIEEHDLPYMSNVLPVRSKLLMTLEEGTYSTTSQTTDMYAGAIVYLAGMPYDPSKLSPREKAQYKPETKIVSFFEKYSDMRETFYREEGKKGGGLRTDTIASRSALVLRSVQAQNCEPHKSDTFKLPYSQSIIVFKAHIIRYYRKIRQWSARKTLSFLEDNLRKYNDDLWNVMNGILKKIREEGGICYSLRYPSIYRWSGQQGEMTEIKKDPNDRTLQVPASYLAGSNGDKKGSGDLTY